MILINVFFQELNRDYDFKVDCDAKISRVTDEMVEMIAQAEHIQMGDNPGIFFLCRKGEERILHPDTTLAENGIRSGDLLLLI